MIRISGRMCSLIAVLSSPESSMVTDNDHLLVIVLDEAKASRAVIVIVSASDERADRNAFGTS